jgi:aryl-alcohol dehydrogenase-like predicted oxidoreductase
MRCTPAQLALAWVLAQGDHIHVIPGTTSPEHLRENWGAMDLALSVELNEKLNRLINQNTVAGARYAPGVQAQIDTEEF